MADAFRVTGFPRLHLGLIDLAGVSRRAYGGAGFTVGGLPTVVTVRRAARPGFGPGAISDAARSAIEKALRSAAEAGWDDRVVVDVRRGPPEHAGLGSTTTAVMCALRGVAALAGRSPDPATLQRLSGRGRTSGIGVNTFFSGGLVVDVGRPRDGGGYRPSSANPGRSPSLRLTSLPMPARWRVSLLLDERAPRTHGAGEEEFFRRHTPVPPEDALAMMAELYHGILPAVLEEDLATLAEALHAFQARGFKRAEIDHQPARVRESLKSAPAGLPRGLSSMGPTVFVVHPAGVTLPGPSVLGPFPFRNEGHECVPVA